MVVCQTLSDTPEHLQGCHEIKMTKFKDKYTMYGIICKQMLTAASAPYTGLIGTRLNKIENR